MGKRKKRKKRVDLALKTALEGMVVLSSRLEDAWTFMGRVLVQHGEMLERLEKLEGKHDDA